MNFKSGGENATTNRNARLGDARRITSFFGTRELHALEYLIITHLITITSRTCVDSSRAFDSP